MAKLTFSLNPMTKSKLGIEQPSFDMVKNTLGLWQASLEDAVRYGGDLTRTALGAMRLRGDRKFTIVDTKVHMLVPGIYPALPGWHTDGVPRGVAGNPLAKEPPNIALQLQSDLRPPRFHLLSTGTGCLTDFLITPTELEVPDEPDTSLYENITQQMRGLIDGEAVRYEEDIITIEPCVSYEWDWWALHTAVAATKHEWRFLIRVTESDWQQPQNDLREVIRTQQQAYAPVDFGW